MKKKGRHHKGHKSETNMKLLKDVLVFFFKIGTFMIFWQCVCINANIFDFAVDFSLLSWLVLEYHC